MTQVSWMKQLALAIVLFVLGTTVYWMEFRKKPQKEAEAEATRKLFTIKDTPVLGITIRDDAQTFNLICSDAASKLCKPGDNSKWQLESPLKLKADDGNANSLLSALNNLNVTDTIGLKDETSEKRAALLKDYGLDPQSLQTGRRIEVRTEKGTTVAYLGAIHPIGETLFAVRENVAPGQQPSGKIDDTQVFLVPTYFKTNFDHDLTYWREKKLLTLASHEISAFQLEGEGPRLEASRKDGQWTLKAGKEEFAGDIENVDALLNSVAFLAARNFVADSKTDPRAKEALHGAKRWLSLTLQKEKGPSEQAAPEPIQLTFYEKSAPAPKTGGKPMLPNTGNRVFATVSNLDPVYELDAFIKGQLNKSLKDLRLSKLISSIERFGARRLEFSGKPVGAQPLLLVQTDGKWLSMPEKSEVSQEKVQDTLDKLSGNRIKEFLNGDAIPAGEDEGIKLVFGDAKTEAKRQFLFWKKGEQVYARDLTSGRKEAFLVDKAVAEGLPWSRNHFQKAGN